MDKRTNLSHLSISRRDFYLKNRFFLELVFKDVRG